MKKLLEYIVGSYKIWKNDYKKENKLYKLIILIYIIVISSIVFIPKIYATAEEAMDLKGEYYEKDGCIYIIGNWTEGEKTELDRIYKKRMVKRTKQSEIEKQRRHELKIETIKAQAMRDYLIAQGMSLKEIAEAIGKIKTEQYVTIRDIISSSNSKIGNISNVSKGGSSSASTGKVMNANSSISKIGIDIKK